VKVVVPCLVSLLGAILGVAGGIAYTFTQLNGDDDAFVWLSAFAGFGLIGAFLGAGIAVGLWVFLRRQRAAN
jgi:hypothetical protein